MPCQVKNVKKAMDIHVYELKVNLPILVYSSADR